MNLANRTDQEIVLELCLARKIKVLDADEWEKVKPWLLELRRHGISPIVVHHTGYDQTRMRGTSSREDAASRGNKDSPLATPPGPNPHRLSPAVGVALDLPDGSGTKSLRF